MFISTFIRTHFSGLQQCLLATLLVVLFITPIRNFDIWWHLQSGLWMLEHGRFLDQEINSFTMQAQPWNNFAWLFQVSTAWAFQVFGDWGLLMLKLVVWLGIVWLLLRSVKWTPYTFWIWLFVFLLYAGQLFSYMHLRPHLFEALFLAIAISFLFRRDVKTQDWWHYALLIWLWANAHASVVVGAPALLLHYVFGGTWHFSWRELNKNRLLIALPIGLLVFVTPNGLAILDVLFEHAAGNYMYTYIAEWQPTAMPILLFVVSLLVCFFAVKTRDLVSPAEVFLLMFFFYMSLDSARFLFEWALLLMRPSAILLHMLYRQLPRTVPYSLLGILCVAALAVVYPLNLSANRFTLNDYPVNDAKYPTATTHILRKVADEHGHLKVWNNYGYGGYLAWLGEGNISVYIDGRTPTVYPEQLLVDHVLASGNASLLEAELQRYQVDALLLSRDKKLPIALDHEMWWLVGFDHKSVLYLRQEIAQKVAIQRITFSPRQYAFIDDEEETDKRAKQLRSLLEWDDNNMLAWFQLGIVLGFGPDTIAELSQQEVIHSLRTAIALDPYYAPSRIRLALFLLKLGEDPEVAAKEIQPLLGMHKVKKMRGKEIDAAAIFLEAGYAHAALKILSVEHVTQQQKLHKKLDFWLLSALAYDITGQVDKAKEAARVATLLGEVAKEKDQAHYRQVVSALSFNRPPDAQSTGGL